MDQFAPLDLSLARPTNKPKVAYIYHPKIPLFHYGPKHRMKPIRMAYTNDLVLTYGLTQKMDVVKTDYASRHEIQKFHDEDYLEFLSSISPSTRNSRTALQTYNIGIGLSGGGSVHCQNDEMENPIFDGVFNFSALSVGASLAGARKLSKGECDIAINWAGGLHHAMKDHAYGFCYLNDGVLGIIELLDMGFHRVLYIDIDIHHGDGVEKAFEETDRVLTVSFHMYDADVELPSDHFFPGTGAFDDVGNGYAVNVPLRAGITSEAYIYVFRRVIADVMEHYCPSAIVLQCGADSLAGDKLGNFNLSMNGHANCVRIVKNFNLPLLVLGGGGYSVKAVAKTWAYETGVLVGEEMAREVPLSLPSYSHYKEPGMVLDVQADPNMEDENDPRTLDNMISKISQRLKDISHAPSVQLQNWNHSRRSRDDDLDEDEGESDHEEDHLYDYDAGDVDEKDRNETNASHNPKNKTSRASLKRHLSGTDGTVRPQLDDSDDIRHAQPHQTPLTGVMLPLKAQEVSTALNKTNFLSLSPPFRDSGVVLSPPSLEPSKVGSSDSPEGRRDINDSATAILPPFLGEVEKTDELEDDESGTSSDSEDEDDKDWPKSGLTHGTPQFLNKSKKRVPKAKIKRRRTNIDLRVQSTRCSSRVTRPKKKIKVKILVDEDGDDDDDDDDDDDKYDDDDYDGNYNEDDSEDDNEDDGFHNDSSNDSDNELDNSEPGTLEILPYNTQRTGREITLEKNTRDIQRLEQATRSRVKESEVETSEDDSRSDSTISPRQRRKRRLSADLSPPHQRDLRASTRVKTFETTEGAGIKLSGVFYDQRIFSKESQSNDGLSTHEEQGEQSYGEESEESKGEKIEVVDCIKVGLLQEEEEVYGNYEGEDLD